MEPRARQVALVLVRRNLRAGSLQQLAIADGPVADEEPAGLDLELARRERARFHAELARDFGPAELLEPIYVRAPNIQGVPA
jgi:hypothetical protein